jgi:CelD/BcsL family acetyltransferase involved in cellulose biosynthesis
MIDIRLVTDIAGAEFFWRALSPRRTIFDEWSFRYCFYRHAPLPLHFFVAWEKSADGREEPVALMPLQYNADWGGLEFFAEEPCEENRVFAKPGYDQAIRQLYNNLPGRAKFYDISGEDEFTQSLPLEDYKFVLPLAGLQTFQDFLSTRLSAKRRRSLSKELQGVADRQVEVMVSDQASQAADLELLFELNHANFADESYLRIEDREPWRDLLKLPYDWRLIVLKINGVKQAVSFSVLYNNEWHYLITGVNFKAWPGLGKYLVKVNLEAALAAGADLFDAGLGDCGWKSLWHFDRRPQYEFNAPTEPVAG